MLLAGCSSPCPDCGRHRHHPAGDAQRAALAWTRDEDGDLATRVDQRIAEREWTAEPGNPDAAVLAYLVRGSDADGLTDTGAISNRAQLWSAQYNFGDGSVVNAIPVQDERGGPTYGESPQLVSGSDGETLLVFRRFGQPDGNGWLGQIALARNASSAGSSFTAPIDLTDEPRQNWQAALTLNPITHEALVAKIGSPPILPVGGDTHSLPAFTTPSTAVRPAWQ